MGEWWLNSRREAHRGREVMRVAGGDWWDGMWRRKLRSIWEMEKGEGWQPRNCCLGEAYKAQTMILMKTERRKACNGNGSRWGTSRIFRDCRCAWVVQVSGAVIGNLDRAIVWIVHWDQRKMRYWGGGWCQLRRKWMLLMLGACWVGFDEQKSKRDGEAQLDKRIGLNLSLLLIFWVCKM